MKKLLSILLCCAVLLPIRGFADTAQTEIDWSAMTEQEIKTVLKAGEKELKKRRKKAIKENPLNAVSFEVKFLLDPGIVLTGDHLLDVAVHRANMQNKIGKIQRRSFN